VIRRPDRFERVGERLIPYPFSSQYLTDDDRPVHLRDMERPGCIPQATWGVVPPEAHAVVAAVLASFFEVWIATQDARIAGLEARLRQNSSNSSRPPSSDPSGAGPTGFQPVVVQLIFSRTNISRFGPPTPVCHE
jgi:hypothetical protein